MAGSMDESAAAIEALRSETGHLQLHSMSPSEKVHIAVEVCLKSSCTARSYDLRMAAERMLKKKTLTYKHGPISLSESDDPFLLNNVESITICDADGSDTDTAVLLFWQVELNVYVYQLNDDPPVSEETNGNGDLASFQEWFLPAKEFQGLWESLVCDTGLKHRLLKYATTALQFAERKVDPNIVSWNRVVLLHGPPGTGKTSLCKALAQKLAIYSSDRYAQAQFLEVNAHSLFSKWFSESGKLVTKLFEKIHELIQDGDVLVFILIDEVESLVAARQAALSGSEPSDSIRVVNSLLTQLDKLKSSSNVFVLTTSNITGAIDIAFLDRADIKAYIGPPSVQARYKILKSCLAELFRTGIIGPANPELLSFRAVKESVSTSNGHLANSSLKISSYLLSAAEACEGLSGRTLRKLPFLAHASTNGQTDCLSFLEALHLVIKQELADRASMTTCKSSLGGFAQ